jgi:hypothetical protein
MSNRDLHRLVRDWAALLAVLAFVLGPLALGVSRSLGAGEKVAIAAGFKPPSLCLPVGPDGNGGGGPDCDHCTALQSFVLIAEGAGPAVLFEGTQAGSEQPPLHAVAFPRAPPARGPPVA